MKPFPLLLPALLSLLAPEYAFAQNYNAGEGSGTGGIDNVFVGPYSGRITTSPGNYNTFVGGSAGTSNTTGASNTFLGSASGYANSTGYANCFVGRGAGQANSTGYFNSFLGALAGFSNTTGYNNSFVGYFAGARNTTGTNNSFLGNESGYANTMGHYNSFFGSQAGYSNTTGSNNSFLGYQAGSVNTTGANNSFLGTAAGTSNTTGSNNAFVGTRAGYNNSTGSSNVFIGKDAGYANGTGNDNAFIGYQAGFTNTTGKHNAFFGSMAGYSTTTGYDNLFFGYQSGNKNTVGYANAFVGAYAGQNSTSGYSNTCFGSSAGLNLTTSARNSFFGNFAGQGTNSGSENVFLGRSAGEKNVNGSFNSSLGNYAGPSTTNLQNATAIGYRASVSASNSLVLGAINGVNGATADAKVGIKTTAPAYNLHVNGTAAKPGGGAWTVASDQRLKQEVTEFRDGLAMVQQIKPVWFRYNGKAGLPTEKKYVGVIAQQMQKIAPYTIGEFVYTDTTGKQDKYLDYDASALTYLLVNSVKELNQQNQQLQRQAMGKDEQIATLTQRLNQLEALVNRLAGTSSDEAAQLWQNDPNPTDGNTDIRFRIPLSATSAQLKVFSSDGKEARSLEIAQRGEGKVRLATGTLPSGTYVYRLVVDGKSIDAKKLLLTR